MNKDKEKSFRNIKEVSLAELKPFEGHPYKVRDDEEMDALIESVREHGIMVPLMVRPIDAGYEIISGHRRAHAAISAGLKTVPVVELEMNRDEAAVALVDSNLHREHILPSEKAFAYKLKLDALSRQGKRTDLTSTQVVEKLTTAQIVGESNLESRETVRRYIRLTHLNPTLLRLVDEGRIAFTPAVELSYLSDEEQDILAFEIAVTEATPSLSQAVRMKRLSGEGRLTAELIASIMAEEKANQREKVSIPLSSIGRYLPDGDSERVREFIIKACAFYKKHLSKQQEEAR
ncbi:MAG: ParB/RepB/Spo0J family partition protein [Clostridia bacterium]|nr:ParB/RepB/Spo0J family partition protein [Clostridia bacterium]